MDKRLELRMSKEMFDELEIFRIRNKIEDKQDAVREILNEKLFEKKNFFSKLKDLF